MGWYYIYKGLPKGPFSTEHIRKEISSSRIAFKDLLYREKDTAWREAQSHAEFVDLFQVKKDNVASDLKDNTEKMNFGESSLTTNKPVAKEQSIDTKLTENTIIDEPKSIEWVVLLRKAGQKGFKQKGPLNHSQVEALLRSGEMKFSDYIWRKGLKEWYKVSSLAEFQNQSLKSAPPPLPISEDKGSKAAKKSNVEEKTVYSQTQVTLASISKNTDSDAKEENAKLENKNKNKNAKKHLRISKKEKKNNPIFIKRISWLQHYMSLGAVQKTFVLAPILLVLAAAFFLFTYMTSYLDRKNIRLLQQPTSVFVQHDTETDANNLVPAPIHQIDVKAAPQGSKPEVIKAPQVMTSSMEPTYLKADLVNPGLDSVLIRVRTDGSERFPITIQFKSEGGQALDVRSIFKVKKIQSVSSREIVMRELGLPFGKYEVLIEILGLKENLVVAYGTETADYIKNLNQIRKQLIHYHNEERVNFIKTSHRIENEIREFIQNTERSSQMVSWRNFYKKWRNQFNRIDSRYMSGINNRSRKNYVHPTFWLELQSVKREVLINTKLNHQQKQRGQNVDLTVLRQQLSTVFTLKNKMIEESLWR